jgi:hypothetical protein
VGARDDRVEGVERTTDELQVLLSPWKTTRFDWAVVGGRIVVRVGERGVVDVNGLKGDDLGPGELARRLDGGEAKDSSRSRDGERRGMVCR